MAVGACSALGSPVIGCYMNPDKRFAFVEFRNVEETSNAMAFDGVTCQVRPMHGSGSSTCTALFHLVAVLALLVCASPNVDMAAGSVTLTAAVELQL